MTSSPFPPTSTARTAGNALSDGVQPALRNALTSLNVNLDYELARYRQARQGEVPLRAHPPQFQPKRRLLNLIAVPSPRVSPTVLPKTFSTPTSAAHWVTPPPPPPNPRLQTAAETPLSATGAEVSALRSALVYSGAPPAEDGYLASSAALLAAEGSSLPPPPEPSFASAPRQAGWSPLTPLGLGGLLLLLVGSASFGFALVNPAVVQNLTKNTPLARLWPGSSDGLEDAEGESISTFPDGAEGEGSPLAPLSPDLSKKEFTNLDLKTLSTVPSGVSAQVPLPNPRGRAATASSGTVPTTTPIPAAPITSPIPTVTGIPSTTTAPPRPAAPPPSYQASPPVYEPAPQSAPAATSIAPSGAPPAAEERYSESYEDNRADRAPVSNYYVVTDYTGDPSLSEAQGVVEDAYVRNFDVGARIQLGAFNTPEGAAALLEALEGQGIEAQIYEPKQ